MQVWITKEFFPDCQVEVQMHFEKPTQKGVKGSRWWDSKNSTLLCFMDAEGDIPEHILALLGATGLQRWSKRINDWAAGETAIAITLTKCPEDDTTPKTKKTTRKPKSEDIIMTGSQLEASKIVFNNTLDLGGVSLKSLI